MRRYIEKAVQGRKNKNAYAFTVYDKRSNSYAGSTRFYEIQLDHATLP